MMQSNHCRIATLTAASVIVLGGLFAMKFSPWAQSPETSPETSPEMGWTTIELTANTWRANRQVEPTVAASDDGNLLVAWASRRQEDGAYGVFAQLLDPLGRPMGTEIHVNQRMEGSQASPSVAFHPSANRALVVWESTHQDGDGSGIVGRWYETSSTGAGAMTDEFPINATRTGDQTKPSAAINSAGEALVAWTSDTGAGVFAVGRLIDDAGQPLSDELALGGIGTHSPIVKDADDEFVIVGSARESDSRPAPLWMRRIDAEHHVGEIVAVAESTGMQDIEPALGVDAAGRSVVAWMRFNENKYDVMRRTFDSAGGAITPETAVDTRSEAWQSGVAVAVAPNGRSIISWNVEDKRATAPAKSRGSDVWAQRYDAEGRPDGEPACLHLDADGRQALPIGAVAARSIWTASDQIAHVWHGKSGSDSRGVGVTLSYPEELTAPTPTVFEPRPGFTPSMMDPTGQAIAAPVFDPDFVPGPPDVNVRGTGPDFGFLGIQSTGWRPPDPEIAVGPDHVVLVVNSRILIRRKSDGFLSYSLNLGAGGFWTMQGAGGIVYDPVCQYDPHSGRFVVIAIEPDNSARQYINIAISDDSDPNGAWNKYRVNVASYGNFLDFPNIGIDEDAVYITTDFVATPTGNWIFILDKADLIAGTLSMNAVQSAAVPNTLGAMTNYDAGSPAQYFATSYFGTSNEIRLKAITDALGSPVLHEVTLAVPTYNQPPGADQMGSTNLVATGDFRIKHGVVRNGSMWIAYNTDEPDGAGPFGMVSIARTRWHEIDLNGWPTSGMNPTLAQSGTLNDGDGVHMWFPDISVDSAGNAGIVFNRSSSNEFVSMARAVRRATDPPGTFRQSVIMQTSTSPELMDRWGDYSGLQEDPADPGVFWGHGEYRTSSWNTWVGRFSPLTPNPLDFALLSPVDAAMQVAVGATLDWEDAQDADSYDVAIATDPGLVNTVATTNVVGSSWAVPGGTLACDTQYYWGVVANGVGGTSVSTPGVFSFTTGLLADLNGDNVVDTADLGLLLAAFGTVGPVGDLNGDNVVDTADLGLLLGGFGQVCN